MKYYLNELDVEELPLYVEAKSYKEAREKLNNLIGLMSEKDLNEMNKNEK